jgi:hypothetical protein
MEERKMTRRIRMTMRITGMLLIFAGLCVSLAMAVK